MNDIKKRARELLAAEYRKGGANPAACDLLAGRASWPNQMALNAIVAALTPTEREVLSESEKDVALAQAVEFAEYVERQAKGAMVDAAKRFLSLPYAQELARRLTPPEGYVLVPVEPTDDMIWAPSDVEVGYPMWAGSRDGCTTDEAKAIWAAMLAARPEVSP